jgi:gliding motility-associated-like protein
MQFKIDILQPITSQATYNGLPTLSFCNTSTGFPVADTATLIPGFGMGHFADPIGNVFVLDSLTGRIDPGQSLPGTHDLLYIPHLPCHDTAVISVSVNPAASAQVIYPGITGSPPQLCQSDPTKNPAFLSGGPTGQFWSVPGGISFGQLGEIIPSGCAVGTYDVLFRPAGGCSDTVLVIAGLEIDSAMASNVGFTNQSLCVSDMLNFGVLPPGWCGVFLGQTILYSGPNAVLPLSQLGLIGGEALQIAYTQATVCSDTDFATVLVLPTDDASFAYPNPAYCLGDPDPFPVMSGQGGGTFSALTPATVLSPLGQIKLDSSGAGQHTIVYTTSGPCPASDTATIYIYTAASAQFSYSASTFCLGELNPTPIIQGAPGGQFTADSGLVIDPDSGTISILLSQPGTYNVTYTLSGGCNTSFSQTIQIIPFDSSSFFSYIDDSFCRDGDHPVPVLFGDTAGTFYGSAGLVFSNRDSGIVDLSRTDPGEYVITFDLNNRCANDPTDTITVQETDNAYFNYPFLSVCEGESPLKIDSVTQPGGVFSSELSVHFSDPFGTVNLQQSIPGGPYPIFYTTTGLCPATSQNSITIFPRPTGGSLESYPGSSVCSGEQISFRAVATGATGYDFFVNGDSVDGLFDLYQSSDLENGDSIICVLSNSAGCRDTLSSIAQINPIPQSIILERPQTLARLDPLRIKVAGFVDGTIYEWKALGIGPVEVYQDSGQTVALDFGEENTFEIGFRLTKTTDPGLIEVVLQPVAGDCKGEMDTVLVEILPSVEAIFVPGVLTPDGNGLNDTWIITWLPEINPDDYEIRLYNRAGGEVTFIHPLHSGWNGENLLDGVYWWSLRHRNGNVTQSGGLTIRRK